MKTEDKRRTILSLIVFVVAINVIGWLAWAFARAQGLGMLAWLLSPFLTAVVLRLVTRDWQDTGIKPKFSGNGGWYAFSLLLYPLAVALVVLIGWTTGATSRAGFSTVLFLQAMAVAALGTLVKNIFEEFAWRGYLTPKLHAAGINALAGHLIVGFIWGTWHLPYYLGLLDRQQFAAYTGLRLSVFLPLVIAGMTAAGIVFGEIRLITGSTWPAVVMHTISNLVITSLLVGGLCRIPAGARHSSRRGWRGWPASF